jgi:hypothetical protein
VVRGINCSLSVTFQVYTEITFHYIFFWFRDPGKGGSRFFRNVYSVYMPWHVAMTPERAWEDNIKVGLK